MLYICIVFIINNMIMIKFYNIISLPTLIVHELLHAIVTFLVGGKVTGIQIIKFDNFDKTFGLSCILFTVCSYRLQNTLISLAPVLAVLISPIVFYFNSTAGFCVLGYQLLTFPVVLPSSEDLESIKTFKTTKELDAEFDAYINKKATV